MTLLLHPRHDEDSQLLWQAAISRGWRIVRSQDYGRPELFCDGPVVIYGGYMWAEETARRLGVNLISPPDDWLMALPYGLTRRRIWRSTVGEVRSGAFPVFIKSFGSGKRLASRVYHSPDDLPDVGDEHEVIAQSEILFSYEYRIFVLHGQAIAWSVYANHGALYDDNEYSHSGAAAAFLTTVMRDLKLPSACVVDVGEIEGADWFNRWAIVEANPAWCSGVYGCDPDKVLECVMAAAVLDSEGAG